MAKSILFIYDQNDNPGHPYELTMAHDITEGCNVRPLLINFCEFLEMIGHKPNTIGDAMRELAEWNYYQSINPKNPTPQPEISRCKNEDIVNER